MHKTEIIKDNANPEWQPFTVSVEALTKGRTKDAMIAFQCYDDDPEKTDDFIGSATVSLDSSCDSSIIIIAVY